jgi:hypothetical protein
MGEVDLAARREGSFERLFAIKRLKPEFLHEPEVRAMFLDEARLAGLVRHPNVVSVVDVGADERGPFLVMEYVEGVPASDLIEAAGDRPLPMEVCLRIARDAAEGLHAAHELLDAEGRALDLVHRDVSPQNILVGFDGVARVTDFGIAKALGRASRTSTGILKGKLGYMAPEQLRFEEPDRRADLFALGVVLFELLTGRRLYRSVEDMDGPRRILAEPPPDLADYRDDVSPALAELSFELLAKDRGARPDTSRAVARRLEAILADTIGAGGAIETADLLTERFATSRAQRKAQVAEALALAQAPATVGPAAPSPVRAGRGRRAALALAGVVLASSVAIAAMLHARARRATAPATAEQANADEPNGPGRPPTVAPSASAAGADVAAVEAPRPAPAPAASASAPPPRHLPTKPEAPRRTGARNGVPLWEHY